MNGRRIARAHCGGKLSYPTLKEAMTALNAQMGSRRKHGQRRSRPEFLRTYRCERCNSWHLTHKEERE